MNYLDWSGNHTLADEAVWLGSILTFIGTLATITIRQGRIGKQVQKIDNNLNHVGEPEPTDGPTLGQRVAKIEVRTDAIDTKLDRIALNLSDLSVRMIEHIADEHRRTETLEGRMRDQEAISGRQTDT